MNLEDQITQLVEEFLPDPAYFITEVVVKPAGNKTKVSVFLDGDQGIDIGLCAAINRQLGKYLESEDLISTSYTLEVSSPGTDRPLKLLRQYKKNIGRKIMVTLSEEVIEGQLQEVHDEYIIVNQSKGKQQESREVQLADIVKTQVLVSFK